MRKVLLSFVGFHDPYYRSGVDGLDAPGPIVSMLTARAFDGLVLFDTPGTHARYEATCEAVSNYFPDVSVVTKSLEGLTDPTDHSAILRYLRRFTAELLQVFPQADWSIGLSSGTPSMHACWLLLAAEGAFPAKLIYGHPPQTGMDVYQVSEVNLDAPEFPQISPRVHVLPTEDVVSDAPSTRQTARELGMVGENASFLSAVDQAGKLSRYDGHILLLGETGVGKECFAKLIHRMSTRADKPMVPVNCSALPAELAESLLFGHKKGAFTGAAHDQKGAFDDADGGTLFLDEIGDMPMVIQAKLLRALQFGEVQPIGAPRYHKVNVRVLAATNAPLRQAISAKTFRADLYQRFSASVIIPTLRQRRDDVARLALFALTGWCRRHNESKRLTQKALARLVEHPWPGNVRELIHAVEYAAITSDGPLIRDCDIRFDDIMGGLQLQSVEPHEGFSVRDYLDKEYERLVTLAMDMTHGNQRQASRLLGISPQALNKKIGSC